MNTPTGPYLEFTVEKDGATSVQAHGFKGSACKTASRVYERALGIVAHTEETDDDMKQKVKAS
jgi:hypothetical protein